MSAHLEGYRQAMIDAGADANDIDDAVKLRMAWHDVYGSIEPKIAGRIVWEYEWVGQIKAAILWRELDDKDASLIQEWAKATVTSGRLWPEKYDCMIATLTSNDQLVFALHSKCLLRGLTHDHQG